MITRWPGFEKENLVGPGDLAVTIDYRDVLSEILTNRLNNPALVDIFPGFKPKQVGVIKEDLSKNGSSWRASSSVN